MKFKIREIFIRNKNRKNKEKNASIKPLRTDINELTAQDDLEPEEIELLCQLRRDLYAIEKHAEYKCFIRSKCRWARYGGKPSKYFLNLEKNNAADKSNFFHFF